MVAWWAGEGNANDVLGGNNGTLQSGVTFSRGEVGQGFNLDGTSSSYVFVPASTSLNVGAGHGLTIEAWIVPTSNSSSGSPIVEYSAPHGPYGVHMWVSGSDQLFVNLVDTTGNNHFIVSDNGTININVIQHVALTYDTSDGTNGVATLYINGVVASGPMDLGVFTPKTDVDVYLGARVSAGDRFQGIEDEVQIFSRALSSTEIQTVYNAGSEGICGGPPHAPAPSPTPPPHGGLSTTVFMVNERDSPTANIVDNILRFEALQAGAPADLIVRVQATTTPGTESSWNDLPNGSNGYMTLDKTAKEFVLNSTNYPLQNGVYFRALSSAPGYPDSISNNVGPFDLAASTPHLGPTTLYLGTTGTGAAIKFRVTETSPPAGIVLRIQATTTPHIEASWADLSDGNSGHMLPYSDPTQFYLDSNSYPPGDAVYFRAVATASGHIDSLSNAIGVTGVAVGDPPHVDVLPPLPEAGSGSGLDPDHPFVVSLGTLRFGAQASTSNSRQIKTVGVIYDGAVLDHAENGATSIITQYTTNVAGDHIIKAFARDDLGIIGYADAVYIRIAPSGGRVLTMTGSGNWNDANNWSDGLGNNGVPGPNDFAIVGSASASITQDVLVYAVSLNGGSISGAGGQLDVTGHFSITGGQLRNLTAIVGPDGTLVIDSDSDVPVSGALVNLGTFKLAGRGSLVPLPKSNGSVIGKQSVGSPGMQPYGFLDGVLTAIRNFGNWVFHRPSVPPRPPQPPPANPRAVEHSRVVVASSFENHGKIINSDGAGFVGHDGGSITSQDGAGIVSHDGGTLIGHDGASLINSDGASVISNDGGSLIGEDGASLISEHGAGIIIPGSAAEGSSSSSRLSDATATAAPTGFVQASGETDLTNIVLVAPVSLQGGVLSGTGVIYGNVTNNGGFISPGHSAGSITISGDYTQGAQGTLIIENGGPAPTQYDQLQVTGNATLNGKLDVRTINGYTPDSADTFSPLGYTSVSGSFSSVSSNAQLSFGSDGATATINPNLIQPTSGQPLNISTRMKVLSGDNVLIAGFIVKGSSGSSKKVLIRGIGPSLSNVGISGTLSDPLLELHQPDGSVVTNDNWQDGDVSQIPNGFAPGDPRESVIVATLTPGNYTAIVKGAHGETGIGLAEVYDLDSSSAAKLANISTRGFIDTGDNVMIGGFIIGGTEPATILVRAIGPTLTTFGVQGALDDPMLELHDANGSSISNDNWRETQENEITATTIPPGNDREPAILATLVPGAYTAVVRGKNNTTGIGLVEAYNLQ